MKCDSTACRNPDWAGDVEARSTCVHLSWATHAERLCGCCVPLSSMCASPPNRSTTADRERNVGQRGTICAQIDHTVDCWIQANPLTGMVPAGSAIAQNPVVDTLKPQNPSFRPIRHLKNQNALSGSKAARRAAANPAHPVVSRLSAHRKASLFPLSSPLTIAPSPISFPFSHLRRTVTLPVFSRLSL